MRPSRSKPCDWIVRVCSELNPWNARLELIRNAAELPESAREKVPLTIAPLIPYLRYVEAPPLLRP